MTSSFFQRRRAASRRVVTVIIVSALAVLVATLTPPPAKAAPMKKPDITHAAGMTEALEAAKRQNSDVQIDGLTTQSTTVAATAQGNLRATMGTGPRRIRQNDGTWADLDPTLKKDGDVWVPKVPGNDVWVGARYQKTVTKGKKPKKRKDKKAAGVRKKVTTTLAGVTMPLGQLPQLAAGVNSAAHAAKLRLGWEPGVTRSPADPSMQLRWPTKLAQPSIDGATATYRNVRPGVDLHITTSPIGISTSVTITAPSTGPLDLVLPFALKGLRFAKGPRGGYLIKDHNGRTISRNPAMTIVHDTPTGPTGASARLPIKVTTNSLAIKIPKKIMTGRVVTMPITVQSYDILNSKASTFVSSAEPDDTHDTTPYMRVGNFATAVPDGGLTESLIQFDTSSVTGTTVFNASMGVYQFDAAACTQLRMFVTAPSTSWTASLATWTNKPATTGKYYGFSTTQGHIVGQPAPCDPGTVQGGGASSGMPLEDDLVQSWATTPDSNFGVTLVSEQPSEGLGARSMCTALAQQPTCAGVFPATNPTLTVDYAAVPSAPTNVAMTPITGSVTPVRTPTVSATVGADCDACVGLFEVLDPSGNVYWSGTATASSLSMIASMQIPPAANLADGVAYNLRVWALADGKVKSVSPSPNFPFSVDQIGPDNPTIFSWQYLLSGSWVNPAPDDATFTLTSEDAVAFQISKDGVSGTNVPATNGTGVLRWSPKSGWHTLEVWAVDAAGNRSHHNATWSFGAGGALISSPSDGDQSSSQFVVNASAPVPATDLAQQVQATWRPLDDEADGDEWKPITAGLTVNGQDWDGTPVSPLTPAAVSAATTPPGLVWDTTKTDELKQSTSMIELQLCFTYLISEDPSCDVQQVQLATHAFGGNFATAPAGPGTVALATGELQVQAPDAALPGTTITAGRTWMSFGTVGGIFGPGWQANIPAPADSVASATITANIAADPQGVGNILFQSPSGTIDTFAKAGGGEGTYTGTGLTGQTGSTVTYTPGSPTNTIVFTDAGGNTTTFTSPDNDAWTPTEFNAAGPHGVTAFTRDATEITAVTGVYSSGGDEEDCAAANAPDPTQTRGCRVLTLKLSPAGTTPPAPGTVGPVAGQVDTATVQYWDTDNKRAGDPITVAQYAYNPDGTLAQEWNPTQNGSYGPLMNQYSYSPGTGRNGLPELTSVTPASAVTDGAPFLAPFTFTYEQDTDDDLDRVVMVTRSYPGADPPPDSITSIVYGVDPAGDGESLPKLDPATTATWDQSASDAPADGVAVFYPDPNHAWQGSSPIDPAPGDYPYADVIYMNEEGATTNTASYGAGDWQISTTQYDSQQRVIVTLSAGNRALALADTCTAAAAVCAQSTPQERARLLETVTKYDDTLQVPIDTWGPAFDGVTSATTPGQTETIRSHTHTVYNEGRPSGDQYANITLATTVQSSSARVTVAGGDPHGADIDTTTVTKAYSPVIGGADGWLLRVPTQVTEKMGPGYSYGDITTKTEYDVEGNPITVVAPGSNGSDGGTTINEYYTGATSEQPTPCDERPEWDGLICRSSPGDAGSGGAMPVTTTTYSSAMAIAMVTSEGSDGTTVTTENSYDPDSSKLVGVSINGGAAKDVDLPDRVLGYDPNTGGLSSTEAGNTTVSVSVDHFGRQVQSTDGRSNFSSVTYDIASRPVTVHDGKGVYTYTYDTADTEHRGLVTAEDAGIGGNIPDEFTASYDAAGNPTTVAYPNGVKAGFTFNSVGSMTAKTYTAADSATLLSWTQTFDGFGRVASSTGACAQGARSMTNAYDNASRLTKVVDTCGSTTTTRSYQLNAASDRVGKTSAVTGGASSSWVNTFDDSDRQLSTTITGAGATTGAYSYDSFGRTTRLPAVDTSNNVDTTFGYFTDGQIASQTQGGTVETFTRDPLGRVADSVTTVAGMTTVNTSSHFAGDSDSPVWIQDTVANTWTRNVTGPGGALALLVKGNDSGPTSADLQLISPHGDVVATIPNTADVAHTAMGPLTDYDEYGNIINGTTGSRYGWNGAAMRDSANQAGLILMGLRLCNPATGRFLTTDPTPGGNDNPYTYPPDPINAYDLDGNFGWGDVVNVVKSVVRSVVSVVKNVAARAYNAFSNVVSTISMGRINIPKIKIPKIKIPKISMAPIKKAASAAGQFVIRNVTLGPTPFAMVPMMLPSGSSVENSACLVLCVGTSNSSDHVDVKFSAGIAAGAGVNLQHQFDFGARPGAPATVELFGVSVTQSESGTSVGVGYSNGLKGSITGEFGSFRLF